MENLRRKPNPHYWLPSHLLMEIFSWLPTKSLVRFRCVSRECYNLFLDPAFVRLHRKRSKITARRRVELDVKQLPEVISDIFLHSDGLALVKDRENRYHVCNPATGQILSLPNPRCDMGWSESGGGETTTMVYVPSTREYKVVVILTHKRVGILTLAAVHGDPTWKDLGLLPNPHGARKLHQCMDMKGYICGTWSKKETGDTYVDVVCLDLEHESFSVVAAPEGFSRNNNTKVTCVMQWEGCYALCRFGGGEMNVWVLRDYKKGVWEKETVLLKFLDLQEEIAVSSNLHIPYAKRKGWIWFHKPCGYYICCYHPAKNVYMEKKHWNRKSALYTPNLRSCNGLLAHRPLPHWFQSLRSHLQL